MTKFDRIFSSTPEDFLVQLDIGWATCAGQDVPAILRRYAKRLESVHVKEFHPYDGFILTGAINTPAAYQPLGLRVKNIRGKEPADLWFASKAIPAKGCWYAHRPRFSQFYGQSQYLGAWRPWRRLGWRDSLEQPLFVFQ